MTRKNNNPSPPIPVPADFAALHAAWQGARRHKRPSAGQMAFERQWLDRISELGQRLRAGQWRPRRAVCFTVARPKLREIHAPDFADRVLHHWLVPRLEAIYEPRFIFDSYANRVGRGTLAAVERLQGFQRALRDGAGQGRGWYLQLDIRDFFYSIHRATLYGLLKGVLQQRAAARPREAQVIKGLQSLCHKLLVQPVDAIDRRARCLHLPRRKQLRHAAPGCGLPIGNLSSQFFANVYLNELDQFVKHQLKAGYYLRYMDDFILLAPDPAILTDWAAQSADFLQQRLRLQLKPAQPQPLRNGVDFLGYRSYPGHRTVRPRVLAHCREKLLDWQARHVQPGGRRCGIAADGEALSALRSMLASYFGHFGHAQAYRLRRALIDSFPWLKILFDAAALAEGVLRPRWICPRAAGLHQQLGDLRGDYPNAWIAAACGYRHWLSVPASGLRRARLLRAVAPALWRNKRQALTDAGAEWIELGECGWLRHGARLRTIVRWNVAWPEDEK